LIFTVLAAPALALACDNEEMWDPEFGTDIDWDSFDSSDDRFMRPNQEEVERLRAAERLQKLKRLKEAERLQQLERKRRRMDRRPRSRTFIYRRRPMHLPQRPLLADGSSVQRVSYTRPRPRSRRSFKRQLDSRRITGVLRALEDEPFSQGQLEIIRETGDRFDLTVRQAIRLVKRLSFDDDQVEALVSLYPSLIDPENFAEVYGLLSFSSDRRELRKRIRRSV
jgi:hypothetical protein